MEKSRIVIMSDSPMGYTGFGQVTDKIATYLHQTQKYEVAVIGWGYDGWGHNKPYPLFPARASDFGKSEFGQILKRLKPAMLLTIADLRMISYIADSYLLNDIFWVGYFPVDGKPIPWEWESVIQSMDRSVCFTKWGKDLVGNICEEAIPLGIDLELFKPNKIDKIETLKEIAIPCLPGSEYLIDSNTTIIGTVARNQPNKNLDRILKTFAELKHKGNKKIVLYLHTQRDDLHINLFDYANQLGIEKDVWIRRKPILPFDMPLVYNMMDVFFLPASGEGFCLPYLEAAACGVPVVGTWYAGPIDYLERIGFKIKVQYPNDFIPDPKTLIERAQPPIGECVRILSYVLKIKDSLHLKHKKNIKWLERYGWNKILPLWDKVIQQGLDSKKNQITIV